MKYVADIKVKLKDNHTKYDYDVWHNIKTIDEIEYKWRIRKDRTYEVVAGLFEDKHEALVKAKSIYITMIYSFLRAGFKLEEPGCESYMMDWYNEEYDGNKEEYYREEKGFFQEPKYTRAIFGPSVLVVEDSFNQIDDYKFLEFKLTVSYNSEFSFDNVDDYYFLYNRKSQELLNMVVIADSQMNVGMRMTMYCCILEHLSKNEDKSENVKREIDNLIKHINKDDLNDNEYNQLVNYLNLGKEMSVSQKCKNLIKKYAKTKYGDHDAIKIFSEAYEIRSSFAHGLLNYTKDIKCAFYIKYIVLDVIKNYMRELESNGNVISVQSINKRGVINGQ